MNSNDNDLKTLEGVDTLKIELRPLASLKWAKRNARTHSKKQIAQIASSISQLARLMGRDGERHSLTPQICWHRLELRVADLF